MADTGEARLTARDAVVRPLSRAAGRPCARPGCPSPARATLSFRYATREAWLEALGEAPSLATYDLCAQHADKTRPPSGWALVDQRPVEDEAAPVVVPDEIGGERTIAVLAAALRAVPDAPAAVVPAPEATQATSEAAAEIASETPHAVVAEAEAPTLDLGLGARRGPSPPTPLPPSSVPRMRTARTTTSPRAGDPSRCPRRPTPTS